MPFPFVIGWMDCCAPIMADCSLNQSGVDVAWNGFGCTTDADDGDDDEITLNGFTGADRVLWLSFSLISRNCSSKSFKAAYRSTDGVELMDELELNVPLDFNELLVELNDIGRPMNDKYPINSHEKADKVQ